MADKVRVRYAPSPTGYQHIGGIRTALFNYLFARANGGDFILRIEDTDQTRYFDGALEDIFETFEWLGIDYDEGPEKEGPYGPYFQSKRVELYQKYAKELIDKGAAYYCYCTSERLEQVRNEQEKNKGQIGYDRRCRDLSPAEQDELKKENPNPVVRLKAPTEGKTVVKDRLFGEIEVENKTLQDFVLLKSDGFPTYHLANIVDDHLMEITHVLRAQEWIPSTPNHVLLYNAFGWDPPEFCHLPMVMGKDGSKLSKRHGATQVKQFKLDGYLPEAIINFIVLLGWSFNDKDEVFSLEELKKIFNLDKINKAPAVFNYDKLNWFNGLYIRNMNQDELLSMVMPFYRENNLIGDSPSDQEMELIKGMLPLAQERLEFINNDIIDITGFMFGDIPEYVKWDAIIPKKTEKETVINILTDTAEILKGLTDHKAEDLKQQVYDLTAKHGVKAGAVFMPVRIAVTGTNKSPDLFPLLDVLGAEKVVNRINAAIEKLKSE